MTFIDGTLYWKWIDDKIMIYRLKVHKQTECQVHINPDISLHYIITCVVGNIPKFPFISGRFWRYRGEAMLAGGEGDPSGQENLGNNWALNPRDQKKRCVPWHHHIWPPGGVLNRLHRCEHLFVGENICPICPIESWFQLSCAVVGERNLWHICIHWYLTWKDL